MNWQPIETAPKDGTRVLYYTPHGIFEGNEPPGCVIGDWHVIDGELRGQATEARDATHWMPLPPPPECVA